MGNTGELSGLSTINIELTSRCNKNCWMCGRRKIDREHPEIALKYGDMDFHLLRLIALQVPQNVVAQLHWNGEPLLYPEFGRAVRQFSCFTHIDTNGKLIVEKADEIISHLDTMTISVFQDDPEQDEQFELVKQFLDLRGVRRPNLIYRCLGTFDITRWQKLPGIVATRVLHAALGSYKYEKRVTVPEIGVCLDLLHHLAIDRFGKVFPCVRLNPSQHNCLGDMNSSSLAAVWNSQKRRILLDQHVDGNRKVSPLCAECDFWGVPTGW